MAASATQSLQDRFQRSDFGKDVGADKLTDHANTLVFRTTLNRRDDGEWRNNELNDARQISAMLGAYLTPPIVFAGQPGSMIRPVVAPVLSPFGDRLHPIEKKVKHHDGIDFGAKAETPVRAAADGTVTLTSYGNSGYGLQIILNHGSGISTRYGHLAASSVVLGQAIKQGDEIGRVGSTGNSTGPHLHFEVLQNGTPVDPEPWFKP